MTGLLYVLAALSCVQIGFLYVIYRRFTLQRALAVHIASVLKQRASPQIAETK